MRWSSTHYASRSGRSVRTIGWSSSAGQLLPVITVIEDDVTYGVNGWPANDIDARHYRDAESAEQRGDSDDK